MFSKDEMLDELRTIFLFEADHILLGRGESAAANFIGFTVSDDGEYLHEPPTRVDLTRFPVGDVFDRGYGFAFNPSLHTPLEESEVQNLVVFMLGTPRAGGISSGGETHRFMTLEGYCQIVVDAVHARWKLEWEEAGDFTVRELALLANMTEGAVRNAIADKAESGLKAMPGSKPVQVRFEEAKRWLSGRRGFILSPRLPRNDVVLHDRIRDLRSLEGFVDLLSRQFALIGENASGKLREFGWTNNEIEAWRSGAFEFSAERARQIAATLDLDEALLAGKALELSMRRDIEAKGGTR